MIVPKDRACPCCTQAKAQTIVSTAVGIVTVNPVRLMCDRCASYAHRLMTCPHEVRR